MENENHEPPERTPPPKKGILARFVESTFAFNRIPFTILFVTVYLVVALWIGAIQDRKVPSLNSEFPIEYSQNAFTDLQIISKTFHPFNSHANDEVHDYILKQVKATGVENVVDDLRAELFGQKPVFSDDQYENAIYSENNNILVKIPGTSEKDDNKLGSVLLSAHYDSVATGHGTIDDGTGIVSMLAVLRYMVENQIRPLRSVIFNFNNNEEVGLVGAEMFNFHEWSKEVEYFVNLEGAGAFGKPVMFRATDYDAAFHYSKSRYAHGSSVLQQGFQSGFVKSETDYRVYAREGYRGVDIAFYKSRSLYHTRRDNIHASSVEAISHMFGSALTTVLSMASDDTSVEDKNLDTAVFFDINGSLFVYPVSSLVKWNITGLVAGPLLVGLMLTLVCKAHAWDVGIRGWGRGLFSIAISSGVTVVCAMWIKFFNPYVLSSQLHSPVVALSSVFLLVNYAILGLAWYLKPVHDQKLILFIEILMIWWLFLLGATIVASTSQASGVYLFTILYYLTLVAVVLGLLGLLVSRPKTDGTVGDSSTAANREVQGSQDPQDEESQTAPTEHTSLLQSHEDHGEHRQPRLVRLKHAAKKSLSYDWSLQFLLVAPIGLVTIFSLASLVLDAIHDAAPAVNEPLPFVTIFLALVSIFMGLLVLPFVHRTHSILAVVLIFVTAVCGLRSIFAFPFTQEWPVAMRFIQEIDLDSDSVEPVVKVSAPITSDYVFSTLSQLPSVKESNQEVFCHQSAAGTTNCHYHGARPWVVPQKNYSDWLDVEILPGSETQGPNRGQIVIHAPENRVCSIKFNTTKFSSDNNGGASGSSPVRKIFIYENDSNSTDMLYPGKHIQHTYPNGAHDLTIYSSNWTAPYRVGFEWIPSWYEAESSNDKLGLHITCSWSEYDEQVALGNGKLKRKIPALNEILEYSPMWTSWMKSRTGLVEVKKYVEL